MKQEFNEKDMYFFISSLFEGILVEKENQYFNSKNESIKEYISILKKSNEKIILIIDKLEKNEKIIVSKEWYFFLLTFLNEYKYQKEFSFSKYKKITKQFNLKINESIKIIKSKIRIILENQRYNAVQ